MNLTQRGFIYNFVRKNTLFNSFRYTYRTGISMRTLYNGHIGKE